MLRLLLSGLALSKACVAAPSLLQPLETRQTQNCNTASNRACWISGSYDINTDYEDDTPITGVTREVSLLLAHVCYMYRLSSNTASSIPSL